MVLSIYYINDYILNACKMLKIYEKLQNCNTYVINDSTGSLVLTAFNARGLSCVQYER